MHPAAAHTTSPACRTWQLRLGRPHQRVAVYCPRVRGRSCNRGGGKCVSGAVCQHAGHTGRDLMEAPPPSLGKRQRSRSDTFQTPRKRQRASAVRKALVYSVLVNANGDLTQRYSCSTSISREPVPIRVGRADFSQDVSSYGVGHWLHVVPQNVSTIPEQEWCNAAEVALLSGGESTLCIGVVLHPEGELPLMLYHAQIPCDTSMFHGRRTNLAVGSALYHTLPPAEISPQTVFPAATGDCPQWRGEESVVRILKNSTISVCRVFIPEFALPPAYSDWALIGTSVSLGPEHDPMYEAIAPLANPVVAHVPPGHRREVAGTLLSAGLMPVFADEDESSDDGMINGGPYGASDSPRGVHLHLDANGDGGSSDAQHSSVAGEREGGSPNRVASPTARNMGEGDELDEAMDVEGREMGGKGEDGAEGEGEDDVDGEWDGENVNTEDGSDADYYVDDSVGSDEEDVSSGIEIIDSDEELLEMAARRRRPNPGLRHSRRLPGRRSSRLVVDNESDDADSDAVSSDDEDDEDNDSPRAMVLLSDEDEDFKPVRKSRSARKNNFPVFSFGRARESAHTRTPEEREAKRKELRQKQIQDIYDTATAADQRYLGNLQASSGTWMGIDKEVDTDQKQSSPQSLADMVKSDASSSSSAATPNAADRPLSSFGMFGSSIGPKRTANQGTVASFADLGQFHLREGGHHAAMRSTSSDMFVVASAERSEGSPAGWASAGYGLLTTHGRDDEGRPASRVVDLLHPPEEQVDIDTGADQIVAEVYSNYEPQKLPLQCKHPGHVVEATILAAAELPDITYSADLPEACTSRGDNSTLSSLQLETVLYAGQRHEQMLPTGRRCGYLIGDGTGVGKGRQIAAIIADNWRKGRKRSIWFSASNQLYTAASRDFIDIGCGRTSRHPIRLISMPTKSTTAITGNGLLFATYSMLRSAGRKGKTSRYQQIMQWLLHNGSFDPGEYDGVIVFDEAHMAKTLDPTRDSADANSKTGKTVELLQEELPHARIVYVSATGATEPRNMGYMSRLGLWNNATFPNFKAFCTQVEQAGVAAMEMVAMQMKSAGMYCSRHLSFTGARFDIVDCNLTSGQVEVYNQASQLWLDLLPALDSMSIPRKQVWATIQRFFLQMLLSFKIDSCIEIVKKGLDEGMAIVIGLFSTGESHMTEDVESDELISAPKACVEALLKRGPEAEAKLWLDRLETMALPENALDKLFHGLGGGKEVAEMSGRRKRFVQAPHDKNSFVVSTRNPKVDNLRERDAFMSGKKDVAVITDAASLGISLQSALSCKNQKPRMHIILQLPWAADKAVQQLGRTHRSNQKTAPEYKLLITKLGGEWRLASTIAARMASLGAMTSADRRAGAANVSMSKFLLIPKFANAAVDMLRKKLPEKHPEVMPDVLALDMLPQTNPKKVTRFLNRLLALNVGTQMKVFSYFTLLYDEVIDAAKREGSFDDGVYDLRGRIKTSKQVFVDPCTEREALVLSVIEQDRGISFDNAKAMLDKVLQGTKEGEKRIPSKFFQNKRSGQVMLALRKSDDEPVYIVYRPTIGRAQSTVRADQLRSSFRELSEEEARKLWTKRYNEGAQVGKGARILEHILLSGSILQVLPLMQKIITGGKQKRLQVKRALCHTPDGVDRRIVGISVLAEDLEDLRVELSIYEREALLHARKVLLEAALEWHGLTADQLPARPPEMETFTSGADLQEGKPLELEAVVKLVVAFQDRLNNLTKELQTAIADELPRLVAQLHAVRYNESLTVDLVMSGQERLSVQLLLGGTPARDAARQICGRFWLHKRAEIRMRDLDQQLTIMVRLAKSGLPITHYKRGHESLIQQWVSGNDIRTAEQMAMWLVADKSLSSFTPYRAQPVNIHAAQMGRGVSVPGLDASSLQNFTRSYTIPAHPTSQQHQQQQMTEHGTSATPPPTVLKFHNTFGQYR